MYSRIANQLDPGTREHGVPPALPRMVLAALGLYLLLGGLISILGWAINVERLTDWDGNGISIQPNAALAAALTGVGVLSLNAGMGAVTRWLGVLVAVIGATALGQHLFAIDLPVLNQALMFGREWGRDGVLSPGRMGPSGSTSWSVIGTCLAVLTRPGAALRRAVPLVLLGTLGISALSLVGYGFGVDRLYALPSLTVIAFQTATFVAAGSIALLAAVPERTPARWFADPGPTGQIARRAVPLIIALPLLIGWVRLLGQRAGLYDTEFGIAVQVFLTTALLLALLGWLLRVIARHETALRVSERSMVSTLESITDGFVILDRDWRYQFVNPEAARLLQVEAAKLLGQSAWDLFPGSRNGHGYRELQRAAAERRVVEFEEFNPMLQRWFSTRAYPTTLESFAVYFRDVTERKQAEAERAANLAGLSRLQALSTKLVQSGSQEPLLREILAAAVELTDASKGNIRLRDPEAGTLRIAVHQGYGAEFLERFASRGFGPGCERAAERAERVVVEDLLALDDSASTPGDTAVLLGEGIRALQSTPLISRGGKLLGMLSTQFPEPRALSDREQRHLDLLARMAADFIERTEAEAALKDADRRKDEFLAMLAHELRNPLAPIINGVGLMRMSAQADTTLRATTEMLDRQVSQLVRLVNDLVDVSRITRGKIELVREPLDLSVVLQQALETARPAMLAKDLQVEVRLGARPVHVNADFTRLMQVVGNLLSNAAKFTPPRGTISIHVDEAAESVAIRVRDTGIGIPREQLPRIFDLFMQGDTSLERSASGLGIGLTLVKKLVELHGGTVEARSAGVGHGAEFIVQLPAVSLPAVEVQPRMREMGLPDESRRILLVDDNVDVVTSLQRILAVAGQETATAHNGREALEVAERFRPHVVLLDIGLPGLNGYEVCRQLRQRPWARDALMVAITGWGADAYRQRSIDAGFDTHLVKPVDAETLMHLLRRNRVAAPVTEVAPTATAS